MTAENYTYVVAQRFASDRDIHTQTGVLVSGQNLDAMTPVKLDSNFKYTALTASTDKAVGVLVNPVDATSGDQSCTVYTEADFILSSLVGWPNTITTDLNKKAVFAGTPMQAISYLAGQAAPATY